MQPPGIVTRKLHNLRVTIPGKCTTSGYSNPEFGTKKPFFVNISAKKYFRKYFGMLIWGLGTTDSWKNQRSKISCYCPINHIQIYFWNYIPFTLCTHFYVLSTFILIFIFILVHIFHIHILDANECEIDDQLFKMFSIPFADPGANLFLYVFFLIIPRTILIFM